MNELKVKQQLRFKPFLMNPDTKISMRSILAKIGFTPDSNNLQFDFGNCILNAVQGFNPHLSEGFIFLGYYTSKRSSGFIDFFVPLNVESYEQGLSFLAYYLRNADLKYKPSWLLEGLTLKDNLPWEKEKKAFRENPHAIIEHEWFRVLVKKLRPLITNSTNDDIATFSFDGTILKVDLNNKIFRVSGFGKPWQHTAVVKVKSLDFLPKRINNQDISIYIWKGRLRIGNRGFTLVI